MMTLEDCRAFYAQEIRFAANVATPGLIEAFARIPREKFLGQAPWYIGSAESRALSAAGIGRMSYLSVEDPRDLYHNVLVSIDRTKDLNNGEPGSLACWIDSLQLKPGDSAFHLGCGVGYYTAIIAEVVGPSGSVVGLELQPDLAARERKPWGLCKRNRTRWGRSRLRSRSVRRYLCELWCDASAKYLAGSSEGPRTPRRPLYHGNQPNARAGHHDQNRAYRDRLLRWDGFARGHLLRWQSARSCAGAAHGKSSEIRRAAETKVSPSRCPRISGNVCTPRPRGLSKHGGSGAATRF
jgi:protein-L-isoaspartate O-methyltransferase